MTVDISRFDVSSTIKIVVYRRILFLTRFPLKKYFVAEHSGLGIELLEKDIDHELIDKAGRKVGPLISIQLDLERVAYRLHEDRGSVHRSPEDGKGADATEAVTAIAGKLGTVLQKIVPVVDEFASDTQKEDKIETWMGAPNTSPNYNAARKKHEPEIGSLFLDGPTFAT
ncbi:hypothetical protein FIBSPDRAFT_1039378 [Athelia psychrophila]|uniref:Uncharacterized protein n=1 Tax=Athelia psychrophila TaxID=1759441 RepID=A0A166RSU3_9AGAM|nr:hypothetical protein FIBSPDRAFT_1039378 [Fibularhizoctonia sp. CBS 109695]